MRNNYFGTFMDRIKLEKYRIQHELKMMMKEEGVEAPDDKPRSKRG